MKILGLLSLLFVGLILGGFAFDAFSDVRIDQSTVTREIALSSGK